MKKSDAAKRFDQWILDNQDAFEGKSEYEKCLLAIDFLVKELGMLPPSAPLDKLGGLDNSWEPE